MLIVVNQTIQTLTVILRRQPLQAIHACTLVIVPSRAVSHLNYYYRNVLNLFYSWEINGQMKFVLKQHMEVYLTFYIKMKMLHLLIV